jgi:3-dehydroquinate synthase
MVAAFRLAERLGAGSTQASQRLLALLRRLGLPTELDRHLDERTLGFMHADKKRKGGKVRFIVPGAPGQTEQRALSVEEISALVRA